MAKVNERRWFVPNKRAKNYAEERRAKVHQRGQKEGKGAGSCLTNELKIMPKNAEQKSIKEDKKKARNSPIMRQVFVRATFNAKATTQVCIDTNLLWMQVIQRPKQKSFREKKEQNLKEEEDNGKERKQNYG